MGQRTEILRQLRDRHAQIPPILGLAPTGLSQVWTSVTPFIAPRFLKVKGSNTLAMQVAAECRSRGLPEPLVRDLGREEMVKRGFLNFIRTRSKGHPQPPLTVPWSLELTFAEPVAGPIALGYASHFGLGLFAAKA